jgi:hypothetical protein
VHAAGRPQGHEDIAHRSRLAVKIATLAASILIYGLVILQFTLTFIASPCNEARS